MQTLDDWIAEHKLTHDDVNELFDILFADCVPSEPAQQGESEAAVTARIKLAASKRGVTLWRNNVGVAQSEDGRPIRYGLANDSARINDKFKSSDLIGITSIVVTPDHIGSKFGVFTALEVKRSNWRWSNTDREIAQLRFLEYVRSRGGVGRFVTNEDQICDL